MAFQHNLPFQFVFVNTETWRNKAGVNRVTDLCSKQKMVLNEKELSKTYFARTRNSAAEEVSLRILISSY